MKIVPEILATLTLISNIVIIVYLFLLIINHLFKIKAISKLLDTSYQLLNTYVLAFIVSLTATLGSLFFSEIMKFQPCILCWYQRIFMYPQPILLYLAIVRNEKVLRPYLLALNIIGALIAGYHYLLQRFPESLVAPCSVVGATTSCIKGYSFYFGYISIPWMALTAFVINIILLTINTKIKTRKLKK